MGMYVPFMICCPLCSHENKPSQSPREGIRKTLAGEFTKCRKCGAEFTEIHVPNRPLVKQVVGQLGKISGIVTIVNDIPGNASAMVVSYR